MALTFQAAGAIGHKSSISQLAQSITINSIAVTPTFRFEGADATISSWPAVVGTNLGIAGAGADVGIGVLLPLTDTADLGVQYNLTKYHQSPSTTEGDTGTDDYYFECLYHHIPTESVQRGVCGKSAGGTARWGLYVTASSVIRFQWVDALSNAALLVGTVSPGWNLIQVFFDYSDTAATGMRMYNNGVLVASTTHVATGSANNAGNFELGRYLTASAVAGNSAIAYCAMYQRSGWFAGGAQNSTDFATFAMERFAYLCGSRATTAAGSPTPPTPVARTSEGMLDRITNDVTGERRLFRVGRYWPRLCRRNVSGSYRSGWLSEVAVMNRCLQSFTIGTSPWVNARGTCSATAPGPDPMSFASPFVLDNTNGDHYVFQSATLTASSVTFSVFAKKGSKNHIALGISEVVNGICWFNLNTGTVGTQQAGVTGRIEAYGNDWYRCSVTFTGTAAAYTHVIYFCDVDGATAYLGDNSTATTVWGAQIEVSMTCASSVIPTIGATLTKDRDDLLWAASANVIESIGTIVERLVIQNGFTPQSNWRAGGFGNGSNNVYVFDSAGPTNARFSVTITAGVQATPQATATLTDGLPHKLRGTWQTNDVRFFLEDVVQQTDTLATMSTPGTFTRLAVGNNSAATPGGQAVQFIYDFRVYDTIETQDIQAPRVVNITPSANQVVLEFDENVSLVHDAAQASKWLIVSPGNPAVTVTAVQVAGKFVTLTTTEHKQGASYDLTIPFYVLRTTDGAIMPEGYTQSYTGVGVVPTLVAARGVDARTIEVTFSEPVIEADALTASNYAITAGGTVTVLSVTKVTDVTYRLTTTEQARNAAYTIQVSNVRDKAGNPV